MRIGIFGDSFAEKLSQCNTSSWVKLLGQHHSVEVYGESGSSVLFSAKKILDQHKDFDLVIWCLTGPYRYSIEIGDFKAHIYNYEIEYDTPTPFKDLVDVVKEFKVKIESEQDQLITARALYKFVESQVSNLLIVPCFPDVITGASNLWNVSEIELQYFFPGQNLYQILSKNHDRRMCHLSPTNSKIFVNYLLQNLTPGILHIDYSIFQKPIEPIEQLLIKL